MFRVVIHASSGAQITIFTASGTSQLLLLPVGIVVELRLQSHDDGCRNHPKHVEQVTDKTNCV